MSTREFNVRLVATDIDGTIVPHHGTVSPRTRAALHASQQAGLDVVLVTGRPPRWMPPVIQATGLHTTAICANGAIAIDTSTREVLDMATIATQTARDIIAALSDAVPDALFAAETPEMMLAGPGFQSVRYGGRVEEGLIPVHHMVQGADSFEEMLAEPVFKLVALSPGGTPDRLLEVARAEVGHLAAVTHSSSRMAFVEIGPAGVTKAATLARYAAQRGIAAAEVIAFGDMPNDAPMLAWAGRGYAMAGAHPEALAAAGHVAPPAHEDGVAQVLEELLQFGV